METKIFLKNVRIAQPNASDNGAVVDLYYENGLFSAEGSADGAEVWDGANGSSAVSCGWWDGQTDFAEPGSEEREGLASGLEAAAAAGMTDVVQVPSTDPVIDSQADVAFLLGKAAAAPVPTKLHPLAMISRGGNGEALSDMRELAAAGAVGFSEDHPVNSPELLRRALEYLRPGEVPVLAPANETALHPNALMHEGLTCTLMGLQGSPAEAETMRLRRDLDILAYAGGHLHIPVISSAESCRLIREARASGLRVTCGTTAFHLMWTDEDLAGFESSRKVFPPYRSSADRGALREAVWDGTIDCVVSDHRPWNLEVHDVEFVLAPLGVASIEWTFPVLMEGLRAGRPDATSSEVIGAAVRALTTGPQNVFAAEKPIQDSPFIDLLNRRPHLTWFDAGQDWTPLGKSRGANTPRCETQLKGCPLGVITQKGGLKLRPAAR